jgi:hypothetical protein
MNSYARFLPALLLTALAAAPVVVLGHGDEVHGDHDARHGGFVTMFKDIHFEVASPPAGGIQVYFTDAMRAELPAAAVSDLNVEIERVGGKTETLNMAISADGGAWEGRSAPLTDGKSVIRIAFVSRGQPVQVNLMSASLPRFAPKPAAAAKQAPAAKTTAAPKPVPAKPAPAATSGGHEHHAH